MKSLYVDGYVIEFSINLHNAQIYDFEIGYIYALCDLYAETRREVQDSVFFVMNCSSAPIKQIYNG